MKYILFILLALGITASSCKFKQKQFVTTLAIEDTVVTNGQIDTAILVLKKRMESEKYKDVAIVANYKEKEILVQSASLDKEWLSNYLLKKSALVFYECYSINELANSLREADKLITSKISNDKTDTVANPLLSLFSSIAGQSGNNNYVEPYIGLIFEEKISLLKKYLALTKDVFPDDAVLFLQEKQLDKYKKKYYEVYFLKDNESKFFVGNHVKEAKGMLDYNKHPAVNITLDPYGIIAFRRMTTKNVNKAIAIVIDGNIISAPIVNGPIEGGSLQISGGFEAQEVQHIADLFSSGYLPLNISFKNAREVKQAE